MVRNNNTHTHTHTHTHTKEKNNTSEDNTLWDRRRDGGEIKGKNKGASLIKRYIYIIMENKESFPYFLRVYIEGQ